MQEPGFVLRRIAAYATDLGLLFAVLAPMGWLIERALGVMPSTGPQIWTTLLVNFSLPAWLYFTIADASRTGATPGKRWLGLRVSQQNGARVGAAQALLRTASKLLPWELVHVSAFALSVDLGDLSDTQVVGLLVANVLIVSYVACAALTRGRRSVHDFIARTTVGLA